MANETDASSREYVQIDLRNPAIAALLTWICPGAGQLWQRRYAKGVLFLVCILGTYVFGLSLTGGHAVYADVNIYHRLQIIGQAGVGGPTMFAFLQKSIVANGGNPLLGGLMAPPRDSDALSEWHRDYHRFFELGTVYTFVAGFLNLLAIFDAYAGPVIAEPEEEEDDGEKPPTKSSAKDEEGDSK